MNKLTFMKALLKVFTQVSYYFPFYWKNFPRYLVVKNIVSPTKKVSKICLANFVLTLFDN